MFLKRLLISLVLIGLVQLVYADQSINISSPNNNIQLGLLHRTNGDLVYQVFYKGKTTITPSGLGMKLKSPELSLVKFELVGIDSSIADETWQPVWGEVVFRSATTTNNLL